MNESTPPTIGFGSLFTPDAISGMMLATFAAVIAGLQASVRGWGLLTACGAAALLSTVLQPVFVVQYGFTWGNYLGVANMLTGLVAGAAFLVVAKMAQRVLTRADDIADRGLDRVLGKDDKKGGQP